MTTLGSRLRHLDPAHVTFATLPILSSSATPVMHGHRRHERCVRAVTPCSEKASRDQAGRLEAQAVGTWIGPGW